MMANYIYITPEQAKETHAKTIEYSGGGTLEELDFGKLFSVYLHNLSFIYLFLFIFFPGLHPQHMEAPRPGV